MVRREAAQMPVDVAAKMHARDDFLTRVTPLGERDRVQRFEVRLLRNRRVVHVDSPLGTPRFHARNVGR